jgi:hypothetical protein
MLQENPGSASTGSHRRSTIGCAVNAVDVHGDEIVLPLLINYGANSNLTAENRYTRILSLFRVVSQRERTRICCWILVHVGGAAVPLYVLKGKEIDEQGGLLREISSKATPYPVH